MKDAQEVNSEPSGFAQFVVSKVKERYPNFYAGCERAWQALQKKRDDSKYRARRLMDKVSEWDKQKDDEDQYY